MTTGMAAPLAVAMLAGMAVACQGPINAALGRGIGSGMAAAGVSFGVGFAALVLVTLLLGQGGSLVAVGRVPIWMLAGGILGAFFVWTMLWSVPVLGVVTLTAALILGQLCAGLVIDATGAFGVAVQPIGLTRIAGVALVAGGLVLSRL